MSLAALEMDLDLEVFSGPFDLLLALVLREEIDLLELDLAAVVLAYLSHIEARGELDLESATEFILLIAALLELKSRLLLPGEEIEDLLEMGPQEAASELVERMIQARRYQGAGGRLRELLASEDGVRFRRVPIPQELRSAPAQPPPADTTGVAAPKAKPERLGKALAGLLAMPPRISLRHMLSPQVTVAARLSRLRQLLGRGRFSFEEAVAGEDRVTVAVTVFALLELYRRGEAEWEQGESFGEITVHALAPEVPAQGPASPPIILAG